MAGGAALALMSLAPLVAHAQTYTVLHSFTGQPNDGAYGNGAPVQDDAGNLYGTTNQGGPYDLGTVFKIDTAGNETVLTKFDYANGSNPQPGLIVQKGRLYDTTTAGGYYNSGTVISINDRGKASVLYSFCALTNCMDGAYPTYGVTRDSAGNLYGTTIAGGAYNAGVVFKVDSSGNETVLYSFCPNGGNCSDGGWPLGGGATKDPTGDLLGYAQGSPLTNCGLCGVVWKLDSSGNESVQHAFAGSPSDGAAPVGLPVFDKTGNMYGVTNAGGSGTSCNGGCGTVFKVDASGNETVLYNFTSSKDGAEPGPQSLVLDKAGNLYGTATHGGAYGNGTVFKLTPSRYFKVLYSFQGQSDGGIPQGGLLRNHDALYGEAAIGGDLSCVEGGGSGCGVVFNITTR